MSLKWYRLPRMVALKSSNGNPPSCVLALILILTAS